MTMTKLHDMTPRAKIALLTGLVLFVAACGGGGGMKGIGSLGQGFVNAFNAGPNTEPVDPDTIALTVDPTADPFNP
jgi:hypothetical protein